MTKRFDTPPQLATEITPLSHIHRTAPTPLLFHFHTANGWLILSHSRQPPAL